MEKQQENKSWWNDDDAFNNLKWESVYRNFIDWENAHKSDVLRGDVLHVRIDEKAMDQMVGMTIEGWEPVTCDFPRLEWEGLILYMRDDQGNRYAYQIHSSDTYDNDNLIRVYRADRA